MVDRVLIDVNGMKISKPGVDVKTAAGTNLLFRSDAAQLSIYQQGLVTYTNEGESDLFIPFGKTFPGVPIVSLHLTVGANNTGHANSLAVAYKHSETGSPAWLQVNTERGGLRVKRYIYDYGHASVSPRPYTVRYWVFDYITPE
jgi:hypothetical protein